MATQTSPQQIKDALDELILQAEGARHQLLQRFAADQEEETRLYKERRDALAKTLPPDHPLLAALDRRILGGTKLFEFYRLGSPDTGGRDVLLAGGWILTGRVLDAKNQPVAGASLRLDTADGELAKRFGEISTGKDGRFEQRFAGKDMKAIFARAPKARLVATSPDGKLSVASRDIEPAPDRTDALDLRLAARAAAPKAKAAKAPKAAKRSKPKSPRL
jgi:hypothetical protein